MQTQNISTLKIHKLSQEQYERERLAGNLDETALYLTPEEEIYATTDEVNEALASSKAYTNEQIAAIPTPDVSGQISTHNTSANAHEDIREAINNIDESIMLKKQTIIPRLPSSYEYAAITFGANGFVATTTTNKAAYSADGFIWTTVDIPVSGAYRAVVYGKDKFVALTKGVYCCYSQDGITWSQGTMPSSTDWGSIAYGNGRFVAIASGSGTSNVAAYSLDGITWTATTLPFEIVWRTVVYGDGKFVALGASNQSAYSTDGVTWTENTISFYGNWERAVYGDDKFVAISGGNSNLAMYSSDGITWVQSTLPSSLSHTSISYGNGKYIVTTFNWTEIAYSNDGITWAADKLTTNGYRSCYGANKFLVISSNGVISFSHDGSAWYESYTIDKVQTTDLSDEVIDNFQSKIIGENGQFVTVGANNEVLTESFARIPAPDATDTYMVPTVMQNQIAWMELPAPFVAQATAPTNEKQLWVDTANGGVMKYHNGTEWTPIASVYS